MTPEKDTQEPSFPRPWYSRPEYMIPMFVFWPAGALLALRSPWNSNVLLGGVAWAVMIVGAFAGFKWLQAGSYQPIMTFYVPGVLLTVITQVQWAAYKKRMAEEAGSLDEEPAELEASSPPRTSARRRRRNPRTGRPRS